MKMFFLSTLLWLLAGCAVTPQATKLDTRRGVHLWLDSEGDANDLIQTLPAFAKAGVNVIVIEINYSYEFKTHPELRQKQFITRQTARALAAAARKNGMRLIPEFNCLGHQSFNQRIEPLLKVHPQFSEMPSQSTANTNLYCLEWCPQAPGLNKIVFSLVDEIAEGFEAEAIHVGMDEVYLLGADVCPRCRGKNPAELFAAQVNALHSHIAGQKKLEMLMWADRVIGPKFQGYSKYDNAKNDLSASINLIPRDIVMCDWHYEWRREYPSIAYLAGKGFRVWPVGFTPVKAASAFSDFSLSQRTNVIGWLATTWNVTSITNAPEWPPIKEILPRWEK
jgi:hypothetical protein